MTGDETVTGEESRAARIRREAGAWHAAMQSGEVSAEMRAAFENWLRADSEHRRAYSAFEEMYRDLGVLLPMSGVPMSGVAGRPAARRRFAGFAGLFGAVWGAPAAAAVALVAFVTIVVARPGFIDRPAGPAAQVYATAIAEISDVSLPDGSTVTLGARSEMKAAFTDDYRRVDLVSGEAFFDVAADPERPFFVAANNTLIRVIGTRFDVKSARGLVRVSVLEGVVEVMKPDAPPEALTEALAEALADGALAAAQRRVLTAGQIVKADRRADLSGVETVAGGRLAQWRTGRLAYENAPLAEIVSDLNRYHARQIRFSSRDIGQLRLTISFAAHDLDQVLDAIEALHPVAVERGPREIRVTPAP